MILSPLPQRNRRSPQTVTQAELKALLHYDPASGVFTWVAGQRSGCVAGAMWKGYISVRIAGRNYQVHRLAWLYMTGEWPADEIDHKNTVRDDNRWTN